MHFESKPRSRGPGHCPRISIRTRARLVAEERKIFSRTWQVVGHAQPGRESRRLLHYGTDRANLAVRARRATAKLRGFYNVCRHRAGPPAEGCGSRKLFRCGYHGWTYGLDGALISATEIEGVEGFRPGRFCLEAGADRGMVQPRVRESGSGGAAAARESGRIAEAGGEVSDLRK